MIVPNKKTGHSQKGTILEPLATLFPLKEPLFAQVAAFQAELKLGDFGWAAIAPPPGEAKVSKPPPTGGDGDMRRRGGALREG